MGHNGSSDVLNIVVSLTVPRNCAEKKDVKRNETEENFGLLTSL